MKKIKILFLLLIVFQLISCPLGKYDVEIKYKETIYTYSNCTIDTRKYIDNVWDWEIFHDSVTHRFPSDKIEYIKIKTQEIK